MSRLGPSAANVDSRQINDLGKQRHRRDDGRRMINELSRNPLYFSYAIPLQNQRKDSLRHTTKNRLPNPSETCALEFKEEFRRSVMRSVSATIDVDCSILLKTFHEGSVASLAQKTVSDGEAPAARQSRDMDSPARSGAYAASLRDTNSVKSRTRFVLRVSPCVRSQTVPYMLRSVPGTLTSRASASPTKPGTAVIPSPSRTPTICPSASVALTETPV